MDDWIATLAPVASTLMTGAVLIIPRLLKRIHLRQKMHRRGVYARTEREARR